MPLSAILQAATPHLICRVRHLNEWQSSADPFIRSEDEPEQEILDEGFAANAPLGPTYWRIVLRGQVKLYLSTFQLNRSQVLKVWGGAGLAYCDAAGEAIGRMLEHRRRSRSRRSAGSIAPRGNDRARIDNLEIEQLRHRTRLLRRARR